MSEGGALKRVLSPLEARVLGVLVEKQHTVPDTYPLSLNALVGGCNQKTARSPVIDATEAEVMTAVDGLKALSLVFEVSGSRVVRYEHNTGRVLGVPSQAVALLAALMLRGPQTAAELRVHTERLHRFADISSVEGFLEELAAKAQPLVVRLARAPGSRESRWAHLLGGMPQGLAAAGDEAECDGAGFDAGHRPGGTFSVAAGELAALKAEQARMAAELATLKTLVARLCAELGVDPSTPQNP
jgi:uncharacterized protein YceH (UPF0502 family)